MAESRQYDLARTIKIDLAAHGGKWREPGFKAIAVHRFGNWRMTVEPKILRAPLSFVYRRIEERIRWKYGIELPYTVTLGNGVQIHHFGGIVINGGVSIGDNTIIRHGVTIGVRSENDVDDNPIIGANVSLGVGCVILGKVHIGDGAKIGANAVVLCDVPPRATAVGVPARIIPAK